MHDKIVFREIYHVCNKSIANYGIFENDLNAIRFIYTLDYYNSSDNWTSFSETLKKKRYYYSNLIQPKISEILKMISYCIMPDHYHILFKVVGEYPVSKYLNDVENSYTRYFNLKYNRKGPLWQSSYRSVRVCSNEQLLHVSRYIHLNPTTSNLVKRPEDWAHSSYKDCIVNTSLLNNFNEISTKKSSSYKKFVESSLDYQKSLKEIKRLRLD